MVTVTHFHGILSRGAVCWGVVDSWPDPAAQGLSMMMVVVMVMMVMVVSAVARLMMQYVLLLGCYMEGGFLHWMGFNCDL